MEMSMSIRWIPCYMLAGFLALCVLPVVTGCSHGDVNNEDAETDEDITDSGSDSGGDITDAGEDAGGDITDAGEDGGEDAGEDTEEDLTDEDISACPLLDFTATPTSGTAPLAVEFSAQLSAGNSVYEWDWDLGDGTRSSTESPARLYYTPGTYTVTLTVTDSIMSCSLTRNDFITITGYSTDPVHVDPDNTGDADEDGSIAHPWDSWGDVTFAAGGIYLQKRGTVASENIRIIASGTESAHITIGAYGDGAKPVLDGTGLGDLRGIYIGQWNAGDIIGYVDVSDFEIRNFQGYGVCTAPNHGHSPHHCTFTNLHLHHSQPLSSGEHRIPGMYLWHSSDDWSDPLYNTVTNCHSEYNSEHGLKISSGHSLVDSCTTNNNGAHGVSCPLESHNVTVIGGTHHDNSSSGVELGGEGSSATNVVCYNNGYGIEINENDNKHVENAACYGNTSYGIFISCHLAGVLSGIIIDRTAVHDNSGAGIRLRNGCENVLVKNTAVYNNADYGVFLDQNSDYTGPVSNNIELQYNLIYNNPTGFRITSTDGVKILNNTFYTNTSDDVSVASSGLNVLIQNSILSSISGNSTEDHNTFYPTEDPLFADPDSYDFHLQAGSPCIDVGLDLGMSEDFEGNPVPFGIAPDIGAFEHVD
jgi:PKD repeat protein